MASEVACNGMLATVVPPQTAILDLRSFDVAGVHVTVLTPYADFKKGSHQYEWLKKDLAKNFDRSATPWLVVAFHAPWYNSVVAHYQARTCLRPTITLPRCPSTVRLGAHLRTLSSVPWCSECRSFTPSHQRAETYTPSAQQLEVILKQPKQAG